MSSRRQEVNPGRRVSVQHQSMYHDTSGTGVLVRLCSGTMFSTATPERPSACLLTSAKSTA